MGIVIGVDVGALGGTLERLSLTGASRDTLLELLDVGCVALGELGECLLGHRRKAEGTSGPQQHHYQYFNIIFNSHPPTTTH